MCVCVCVFLVRLKYAQAGPSNCIKGAETPGCRSGSFCFLEFVGYSKRDSVRIINSIRNNSYFRILVWDTSVKDRSSIMRENHIYIYAYCKISKLSL